MAVFVPKELFEEKFQRKNVDVVSDLVYVKEKHAHAFVEVVPVDMVKKIVDSAVQNIILKSAPSPPPPKKKTKTKWSK